jgi:hypothetical protein
MISILRGRAVGQLARFIILKSLVRVQFPQPLNINKLNNNIMWTAPIILCLACAAAYGGYRLAKFIDEMDNKKKYW